MNVPPRLPTEGAAATYAPPIIASNWRPIGKGTLVGTADLYIVKWRTDFFGPCGTATARGAAIAAINLIAGGAT